MATEFQIRNAQPNEFEEIGKLMIQTYAQLDGFPKPHEQPKYYNMLANIGEFIQKPNTELLIAHAHDNKIVGTVVYFSDMKHYGSGGTATQEINTSAFRLLAVDNTQRGKGIGKHLALACIQKAVDNKSKQMIIHTTTAMQAAWTLYESLGFIRSNDLDFLQEGLPIYGFRLKL